MIVRQVDPETQRVRTIVQTEEGRLRAFGENTVASLVSSAEKDAHRWVNDLSDRELRGLVHEVGQRLLSSSRAYQSQQAQLEEMADSANYAYFGLSPEATEKDLDNAYRQLAKKMHPDKNGGTDEAKQRFQCMKERYEKLKARRREESTPSGSDSGEKDEEEGDWSGRSGDPKRREAYDEDEEDEEVRKEREREREQDRKIEYDPTDRQSLHETVWRMLKQFKSLQQGLEEVGKQLRRARSGPVA
uniref:J domain-containing protein n=1 Tax=Alexandrium monilatum TaxID=311494 RepID=A0A7S4QGA9_9DINO